MAYIEIEGSFHENTPVEQKADLVHFLDSIADKTSSKKLSYWQTDSAFYRFLEVPDSVGDSPEKSFYLPDHVKRVAKTILFKQYRHYSPEYHKTILEEHFRSIASAFIEVKNIWKAYWVAAIATAFIVLPLGKYWTLAWVIAAAFGAWKCHQKAESIIIPVRNFTRSRWEALPDFQKSKMIREATQTSRKFGIPEDHAFF